MVTQTVTSIKKEIPTPIPSQYQCYKRYHQNVFKCYFPRETNMKIYTNTYQSQKHHMQHLICLRSRDWLMISKVHLNQQNVARNLRFGAPNITRITAQAFASNKNPMMSCQRIFHIEKKEKLSCNNEIYTIWYGGVKIFLTTLWCRDQVCGSECVICMPIQSHFHDVDQPSSQTRNKSLWCKRNTSYTSPF